MKNVVLHIHAPRIACQNGGVYKHIPDSEAKHLKEAMAGYYTCAFSDSVDPS